MRLLLICLLLLASIGSAAAQSCCSPGTTSDNKRTVILNGPIVPGDEGHLLQFLARNPGTILMELNSPGGSLRTGMAIGRIVYAAHLETYVGPGSFCASACAMIWLAGAPMVASTEAQIGFHAAVNQETGHEGLGSALMGRYFADLGLDDEAIMWMTEKDPEHLNFLNLDVIRQLRLNMKLYDAKKDELYDIQGGVFSITND
jgi:hypothetical protein